MATITVAQPFGSDLLGFMQDIMENYAHASGTAERKTYSMGLDYSSYVSFRGQPNGSSPGQKTVDKIVLVGGTIDFLGEPTAIILGEITNFSLPVADVLAAALVSPQALMDLLGNITFNGNSGRDIVTLGAGNDSLNMGAGNDEAHSGAGNDILRMGAGNDEAHGGAGNDLLEGWSGNDVLYGDDGDDLFYGNTGNDKLYGGAGNDTIHAGEDDDYLDGGAGNDILSGSTGNDTYVVSSTGDQIFELAGEGTDTVRAGISWTLGANLEQLELQGSANINGIGNAIANVITGNSGNNVINGLGGVDTMRGLGGNDRYYVDNTADVIIETSTQGTADRVLASVNYSLKAGVGVEILSTTDAAGTAALKLAGNSYANTVVGNAGNNLINGGLGADTLTGLAGKDTFMFNTALGSPNVDTITDFNVADDTIRLENGIFTALSGTGTLTAAQFVKNTTGLAQDANDRIIYETDTGKLFYDANGSASGGRLLFATLDKNLALTAGDFFIV